MGDRTKEEVVVEDLSERDRKQLKKELRKEVSDES